MNLKELAKDQLLEAAYNEVAKNQALNRENEALKDEVVKLSDIIEEIYRLVDEVKGLPWWKKALKAVAVLSQIIDFVQENLPKAK